MCIILCKVVKFVDYFFPFFGKLISGEENDGFI